MAKNTVINNVLFSLLLLSHAVTKATSILLRNCIIWVTFSYSKIILTPSGFSDSGLIMNRNATSWRLPMTVFCAV